MIAYPATSVIDLAGLAARAAWTVVRSPRSFDMGLVMHQWMKKMTIRHGSANVILNFVALKLLLVTDRQLSRHILAGYPSSKGYTAGTLKVKGMSYLARRALTLAQGDDWARLRPFNERVLCTGRPHEYQRAFLAHVLRAFSNPVYSIDEIRDAMGGAMLDIVFGEGVAPAQIAADITILFGLVQSPVKRFTQGGRETPRLNGLYYSIGRLLDLAEDSPKPSLIALARAAAGSMDGETLRQQVPHWMFTFTGSGTDLLARGLAMIGSRAEVLARARAEIAAAGPLDDPQTIDGLRYLEACLLEAARLFPPVTWTFHRAPAGDVAVNPPIPAGTEIVQVFSLIHRDDTADVTANDFRPERWMSPGAFAEAAYPNLFLSGARKCPGRDLILFVCKAAAARLLQESQIIARNDALATDPVPFSFPDKLVQFVTVA